MSKLLEAISHTEAGRTTDRGGINVSRHWDAPSNKNRLGTEYLIGVTFWNKVFISDKVAAKSTYPGQLVDTLTEEFKRLLAQEMYGELKNLIFTLHKAIYAQDFETIESCFRDIAKEIEGK